MKDHYSRLGCPGAETFPVIIDRGTGRLLTDVQMVLDLYGSDETSQSEDQN